MLISQNTIEKIKELPILDVVLKYPDIDLKKNGTGYKGFSPWSKEKSPSFFVHPGKNIFKDFSTGKGGNNAIAFVMQKESCEFIDAVKILAQEHSIDIEYDKTTGGTQPEKPKLDIRGSLEWACAHFCANSIPESFTKFRSFPEEILEAFKIGYAKPSWDDLLKSGVAASQNLEALVAAGLIKKREGKEGHYDFFRDRIMFPIQDYRGNIVAFTGRDAETQTPKEGAEKPSKYTNSPDTCYDKSVHLYGLYQALKDGTINKSGAYLVEGPTDVLRWHLHGLSNTVAPCGSALTEQQAKLLKRFTDKITFVPDNDCDKEKNPGIDAMNRNVPIAIKLGFTVKVLIPGIGGF
jgi:DNA primase